MPPAPSSLYDDPDAILATTAELLDAAGLSAAANVLRSAEHRFENTDYDNWNGGTYTYTLFLSVPPEILGQMGASIDTKENLEAQITERLKLVAEQYTTDWLRVSIVPAVRRRADWRQQPGSIDRSIRLDLFDALRLSDSSWHGGLGDVEFLERLFDLSSMKSTDGRFSNAAGDIWQHRENNDDWPDDWVFTDERFHLLDGPDDLFLSFLCETLHPVLRRPPNETARLATIYNDHLRKAGWHLSTKEVIAGRPRYEALRSTSNEARSIARAQSVADALSAAWMQKEIQRLENAIETDPSLAIGTAKDLVESCCKTILSRLQVQTPKAADLPTLTKLVAKELRLVPDEVDSRAKGADIVRVILSNLSSLTTKIAELRGLYGSGHGRDGKHRGLEPRHARLAAGAAIAFIDFVTETYHRRQSDDRSS